MAQVQTGEAGAVFEHAIHICDFARVEVVQSCDGGEAPQTIEPTVTCGGPSIGKRGVEFLWIRRKI